MQLFVWRGRGVLQNYGTGMVVVASPTLAEAWTKLSQQDAEAYWYLKTGRRLFLLSGSGVGIDSEDAKGAIDLDEEGIDLPEPGYPVEPTAFDLGAAPVLVIWGGE